MEKSLTKSVTRGRIFLFSQNRRQQQCSEISERLSHSIIFKIMRPSSLCPLTTLNKKEKPSETPAVSQESTRLDSLTKARLFAYHMVFSESMNLMQRLLDTLHSLTSATRNSHASLEVLPRRSWLWFHKSTREILEQEIWIGLSFSISAKNSNKPMVYKFLNQKKVNLGF